MEEFYIIWIGLNIIKMCCVKFFRKTNTIKEKKDKLLNETKIHICKNVHLSNV